VDLGPAGKDEEYGNGRIDILASLPDAPGKAGDTDGDGDIDDADVTQIVSRFGARAGGANYDAKADCNSDGVIDELDLFVVGRQFGK
jgi:Dockerin type I domain